ncbi:VOC family protein [bacterium]|nr:VOC family protein [bacterium]MCI0605250.1 VOC family protein [bacterium]
MISKLSHMTIWVLNQQEAHDFYVNKLGFEVRTDHTMEGGFRWLTVGPKDQKDLEIVLMEIKPGMMFDENTANQMKALVQKGAMGAGVFETPDCRAAYQQLSKNGVEFVAPPEEKFYGVEAIFKDNSGNWFSLTQRKPWNP